MPIRDEALVETLMPDFYHRQAPDAAMANYASALMMLGGIRAAWTMGPHNTPLNTITAALWARDIIGAASGSSLRPTGRTPVFGHTNLAPWVYLTGGAYYYCSTDNGDLVIQGTETYTQAACRGLLFGGWVNFGASGRQHLAGRWNSAGGAYAYALYRNAAGQLVAALSSSGTAQTHSITSSVTISQNAWYFVALSYRPSTSLSIAVNGSWNTASAPASIAAVATTQFTIGAEQGGTYPATLYASGWFIAGQYHDASIVNCLFAMGAPAYGIKPRL